MGEFYLLKENNVKKHKLKIVIGMVLCIVVCIAYGYRYQMVNAQIKNPEIKEYNMGEQVEFRDDFLINYTMKGYALKVEQAKYLHTNSFWINIMQRMSTVMYRIKYMMWKLLWRILMRKMIQE